VPFVLGRRARDGHLPARVRHLLLAALVGALDRGAARVQLGDAEGALPELARDAHARVAQLDLVPVRAHALDRGEAEGSGLRNGQKRAVLGHRHAQHDREGDEQLERPRRLARGDNKRGSQGCGSAAASAATGSSSLVQHEGQVVVERMVLSWATRREREEARW
jgi:hypothetical protein